METIHFVQANKAVLTVANDFLGQAGKVHLHLSYGDRAPVNPTALSAVDVAQALVDARAFLCGWLSLPHGGKVLCDQGEPIRVSDCATGSAHDPSDPYATDGAEPSAIARGLQERFGACYKIGFDAWQIAEGVEAVAEVTREA